MSEREDGMTSRREFLATTAAAGLGAALTGCDAHWRTLWPAA